MSGKNGSHPWVGEVKNLIFIVLGIAIYSVGFTVFILPHHIVIGGMTGLATLVFYASAQTIPVAVTMYGINVLLLIAGFRYIGKGFVMRTIFGATVMSLMIGSLEGYFTSHPPIITDTLMSVITGAVLIGLGIGVYYSHHGTTGGTDIVAAIMSKVSEISIGRVMMVIDISIVACSILIPYDGSIESRLQARIPYIIYGWLSIFLYSLVADKFVYADRQTVQFIILSDSWQRIADRITHETGRGCTTWEARGHWTGTPRTLMMVWCRKADTQRMFEIIHSEDPDAYITNTYVRSVYGNGFDTLHLRKRRLGKYSK